MKKEISAELKRLALDNGGHLRPVDVVEAARNKKSALHNYFEWNNTRAAERYRLWQARQLIAVTVEYIGYEGESEPSRVFVSLPSDRGEGNGYAFLTHVITTTERHELLADALRELKRLEVKYGHLRELAALFVEARKVSKARDGDKKHKTQEISV